MAIAVAVAVMLASLTLTPLTVDRSYLRYSWVIVVLLGALTAVLRRVHVAVGAILGVQAVVLVGALLVVADLLPRAYEGESYLHSLGGLYIQAARHMQSQSAPMPPNAGVTFLLVSLIGVIALITDLMAATLRRAGWALAPLLTLYLVPALGLPEDVSWMSFVLIGVGYLGILLVEGMNTTARWTRGLAHDSAHGIGTAEPVVVRAAMAIGVPVLILTLIVGAFVPQINWSRFEGQGGGGNGGPLQLTDPTTDLQRNLNLPAERTVLTYTTTSPDGEYLRMASLPKFDSHGWQNSSIEVRTGKLSRPPGLTVDAGPARTTTIQVDDFGSEYLPAPYAPTSFDAAGRWGFDPDSLVILSTDRHDSDDAIRNLRYTVHSVDVTPTLAQLEKVKAGDPPDAKVTAEVPKDLPQSIRQLAFDITKGAKTPADKAADIQAYLRSSVFTYSTEQLPGSGYQALENFLFVDHTGYCVQFAAAMAVLARVVGIPTRFAVGTLPGTLVGDHWVVTNHQLHAWPELYFSGWGWVRYDPTPSVGTAPPWSILTTPTDPGTAGEQPTTVATAPAQHGESQAPVPEATHQPVGAVVAAASHTAKAVAISLGLALVLVLILLIPMALRTRVRRRRLASLVRPASRRPPPADRVRFDGLSPGQRVEAAWSELRDTRVDLRAGWPSGSPRTIARSVGSELTPQDAQALNRLAVLVERGRYARRFDDAEAVAAVATDTRRLRAALLAPHGWRRRALARLAPRSLWVNLRSGRVGPGSSRHE